MARNNVRRYWCRCMIVCWNRNIWCGYNDSRRSNSNRRSNSSFLDRIVYTSKLKVSGIVVSRLEVNVSVKYHVLAKPKFTVCSVDIYLDNLKARLKRSAEIVSNKTSLVCARETDLAFPICSRDVDIAGCPKSMEMLDRYVLIGYKVVW